MAWHSFIIVKREAQIHSYIMKCRVTAEFASNTTIQNGLRGIDYNLRSLSPSVTIRFVCDEKNPSHGMMARREAHW